MESTKRLCFCLVIWLLAYVIGWVLLSPLFFLVGLGTGSRWVCWECVVCMHACVPVCVVPYFDEKHKPHSPTCPSVPAMVMDLRVFFLVVQTSFLSKVIVLTPCIPLFFHSSCSSSFCPFISCLYFYPFRSSFFISQAKQSKQASKPAF